MVDKKKNDASYLVEVNCRKNHLIDPRFSPFMKLDSFFFNINVKCLTV